MVNLSYSNLLCILLILWTEVVQCIGDNISRTDRLTKIVRNTLHRHALVYCFRADRTCVYPVWKCKPQADCCKEHLQANDEVLVSSSHRTNSDRYRTIFRIHRVDGTNFLENCKQETCN